MSAPRCVLCETILGAAVLRVQGLDHVVCPSCRSWTRLPRPSPAAQVALHDREDYFEHPYLRSRRNAKAAARRRARRIFGLVASAHDLGSLRGRPFLDVGCDTGEFLSAAVELVGVVPAGVEVARRAAAAAASRGILVHAGPLEEAPGGFGPFDGATAIDVLEHVADPLRFLAALRERLVAGAPVYVQVPNVDGAVYVFGRFAFGLTRGRPHAFSERLFPREHIQHLTRVGLRAVARRAGFEVVAVGSRPLPRREIAAGPVSLAGVLALQCVDAVRPDSTLLCAVLRRR